MTNLIGLSRLLKMKRNSERSQINLVYIYRASKTQIKQNQLVSNQKLNWDDSYIQDRKLEEEIMRDQEDFDDLL